MGTDSSSVFLLMIMKKFISGLLGFIGGSILAFSISFGKIWIGIIAIVLLFIISQIIYWYKKWS